MTVAINYFELFDLPSVFQVDSALLAERYRQLQQVYHPDRFAGQSAREIRVAVQKASLVNQAYETLKSPVARAQHLLELQGLEADQSSHVTSDVDFLMQQMALRESLQSIDSEADPFAALSQLQDQAEVEFEGHQRTFEQCLQMQKLEGALEEVAKMQFFAKFLHELDEMDARLEQDY